MTSLIKCVRFHKGRIVNTLDSIGFIVWRVFILLRCVLPYRMMKLTKFSCMSIVGRGRSIPFCCNDDVYEILKMI